MVHTTFHCNYTILKSILIFTIILPSFFATTRVGVSATATIATTTRKIVSSTALSSVLSIIPFRKDRVSTPSKLAFQHWTLSSRRSPSQKVFSTTTTTTTTTSIMSATTDNNNANDTTSTRKNPLERLHLPQPLLLGSASFTRKLILKEMGIPFHKLVRPIDEKALGNRSKDASPQELVLMVAQAKMDHLMEELQAGHCDDDLPTPNNNNNNNNNNNSTTTGEWILLTGDQVVTCHGNILEKPESIEQAKEFCHMYQTHPPSTVGSCILTHVPSGIQVSGVDAATIYFQSTMDGTLIDRLVELDEPILSCAGGLMIEHPYTKEHLDHIDGTEDSVMGLSKDLVLRLLQELHDKLQTNNNYS